jgi:rubrerythrin
MPNRKETFILAIQAEIMSQNLYKLLAAAFTAKPEISSVFAHLVPMEMLHEEKLRALFRTEFPDETIHIDPTVVHKAGIENISDPEKVLEFAITREEIAFEIYTKMAAESADPDTIKLLNTLAEDEDNHKIILQTEILRLDNLMTWFDPSELNGLVED